MAKLTMPKISVVKNTDALLAIGVVTVIMMIIIPLPTVLLDLFIAVNLTLSIIIILTVMYSRTALDFSVFPSLLLITTIFGLAINISSTRLILLKGSAFDGKIIRAFGDFVVSGNYVVGFIIFVIILAVQFIVITRGASRISEVQARFTLDRMPGKQMTIDSDYNAGIITEEEKKKREDDLNRESQFYGSMDGASKFVQGNVIVGLIITVVNLIGGLIIGSMAGMGFSGALKFFALLTVGDGLVSQLPALLISTATGIIITRSADRNNLGQELSSQILSEPRASMIAAGVLFLLMLLPGFPKIPLFFLSTVMGGLSYVLMRNKKKEEAGEKKARDAKEIQEKGKAVKPDEIVRVEALELEIGYSLIPLADQESGGDLLDRIAMVRRNMALEMGLVIPPIRIRDNVKLDPAEYSILINGTPVARGQIKMGHYLAVEMPQVTEKLKGEETVDPAFGLPSVWIRDNQRQQAEASGYTVADPPLIMSTHLTEVIKSYGYELLGRQEVRGLLDNIRKTHPVLVDEVQKESTLGEIQKVLQNLLMERIPIRNMVAILETIADHSRLKNPDLITEYVRQALKRQVTSLFKDQDNSLKVVAIDPEIEELLGNSIQEGEDGFQLTLDPKIMRALIQRTVKIINRQKQKGLSPVFLTSPRVRATFKSLLLTNLPSLVVLSYNEIDPSVRVETVEVLSFRKEARAS